MSDIDQKIDLSTYIGSLDSKIEPKTLEECFREAGGFPFVAKVICPVERRPEHQADPIPLGTEFRFYRIHPGFRHDLGVPYFMPDTGDIVVQADIPRWQLLGHKT